MSFIDQRLACMKAYMEMWMRERLKINLIGYKKIEVHI